MIIIKYVIDFKDAIKKHSMVLSEVIKITCCMFVVKFDDVGI